MTSSNVASQASSVTAPSVGDVYEYQALRVRRSPAWEGSDGSTVASTSVPWTGTSSVSGWAAAKASLGGGAACAEAGTAAGASKATAIGSRRRMIMVGERTCAAEVAAQVHPARWRYAVCATPVAARTASARRLTPSSICSGVTPL